MVKTFLLLLSVAGFLATSCAHTPTWSQATARQRAEGNFTEDDAYLASPQCAADVEESAYVITHLRR